MAKCQQSNKNSVCTNIVKFFDNGPCNNAYLLDNLAITLSHIIYHGNYWAPLTGL